MKKLILRAAMLASPLLVAMPAAAQDGGAMMAAMFPDPDGDGVTTRDEMIGAAATRFDQMDADTDGKLSETERSGPGGRIMARADADGDGSVTKAELTNAAGTRFDRIDANHDGKIDAAEKEAARQRMMQMRQGQ